MVRHHLRILILTIHRILPWNNGESCFSSRSKIMRILMTFLAFKAIQYSMK
uniref:Candidate secreted effector n=1 Tax=Meloidogyne incognita TaxID=6306 RepID=A0A914LSL0_MELIC